MKIEEFKNENEKVLWTGKPNKSVFIKEHVFSPFLIMTLLWLIVDGIAIFTFLYIVRDLGNYYWFVIPFFAFHFLPVLLYVASIIASYSRWKKTEYMVTDLGVYVLTGVFSTNCTRKSFQDVTNVSVHQGIIDKRHDVGDVYIQTVTVGSRVSQISFVDLPDYMDVYKLIAKTGQNIFSDTMFPNNYRPAENNGCQTKYNPEDKK